jgi:hypothetical protein
MIASDPGDFAALELQRLVGSGLIDPEQALLRIDYRREAKNAPFQFDMVNGRLHRSGCPSIPAACAAALYAVWDPGVDLETVACSECRPSASEAQTMSQDKTLDVLYGFISLVDQFSSVLKERGKEYRTSAKGQKLEEDLNGMFATLDQTQREALRVTLDSLDGLVKAIESAKQASSLNGEPAPAAAQNGNHRREKEGL